MRRLRPGWKWADADVDQAAGYMKRIVEDAGGRQRIGDRARSDIAGDLSHAIVARAIGARLSELAKASPADRSSAFSTA